jgi:hypothetical protein
LSGTDLLKYFPEFLHRNIILPFDVNDQNNDSKTELVFHLTSLHAQSRNKSEFRTTGMMLLKVGACELIQGLSSKVRLEKEVRPGLSDRGNRQWCVWCKRCAIR